MGSHRRVQEVRGGSLAFDLLPRDAMEIGSAHDRSGGHTERRLSYRIEEADGPSELVPDLMLPMHFIELLQRPSEQTPELRLMAAVVWGATGNPVIPAGRNE